MGDRTNVTLTILVEHLKKFEEINSDYNESHIYSLEESTGKVDVVIDLYYEEVNYGELPFLNELINDGIAFTSCWSSGGDFDSGYKAIRFSPEGELEITECYDNYRNPSTEKLMDLLDDYKALRTFIEKHHKEVTYRDWENQDYYGKLFLSRRLIDPQPIPSQ